MLMDIYLEIAEFLMDCVQLQDFMKNTFDSLRNFFLTLQNGNCCPPRIRIWTDSLITFTYRRFSQLPIPFFPLGVCEQKWKPLITKPRTFWVWSNKTPNLQTWLRLLQYWLQSMAYCTIFLISSFLWLTENMRSNSIT